MMQPPQIQSKSTTRTVGIVLLISSLFLIVAGLCTLPIGVGIFPLLAAGAFIVGGLLCLVFA